MESAFDLGIIEDCSPSPCPEELGLHWLEKIACVPRIYRAPGRVRGGLQNGGVESRRRLLLSPLDFLSRGVLALLEGGGKSGPAVKVSAQPNPYEAKDRGQKDGEGIEVNVHRAIVVVVADRTSGRRSPNPRPARGD